MVLICYDGSPDARSAIEHAAELLDGQPVTVLTVWEPFVEVLARTPSGFGLAPGMVKRRRDRRGHRERRRGARRGGRGAGPQRRPERAGPRLPAANDGVRGDPLGG